MTPAQIAKAMAALQKAVDKSIKRTPADKAVWKAIKRVARAIEDLAAPPGKPPRKKPKGPAPV